MGKRKSGTIKLGGALLLVVLAAALIVFVFRAKTVDVYGNTQHTAEEIAESLTGNLFSGNTLYLAWKYRKNDVPESMPYLESVHVDMKSPSHIAVQVTERAPVACIDKSGYAFFDNTGMVLGIADQLPSGIPLVTGMNTEEVLLYQKLPAESSAQLRTVLSLAQLLQDQGLSASEIRFSDSMEITVFIGDVEAQMGQDEYMEEKVANLSKILTKLGGQSGVLHLESFTGRNEIASFTRSEEEESERETEEGAAGSEEGSGTPEGENGTDQEPAENTSSSTIPMVFNSSGTLVYNVHIENGVVVDQYGSEVPGCYVDENGNVVDAYMNVINPDTGELVQ